MATSQPGGLLDRWRLLGAILHDERARIIHAKVAWPILENYYGKHGNSRASVRFIQAATGLTHGSIVTATADLVEWGFFSRTPGAGTRPTEYTPHWPSALQPPNANASVLQPPNASVLPLPNAGEISALQPPNETLLPVPAYTRRTGEREGMTSGGATGHAPLGSGGAAVAPLDFERLWQAYGVKVDRAKAKEAFGKIDAADPAMILAGAERWRAAYDTETPPRPARWRKRLHTWLQGECWHEDDPAPYERGKAAKRRQESGARNSRTRSTEKLKTTGPQHDKQFAAERPTDAPPIGWHDAEITAASTSDVDGDTVLTVRATTDGGETFTLRAISKSPDGRREQAGREELTRIARAAGFRLRDLATEADLIGRTIRVHGDDEGGVRYEYPDKAAAA